MKRFLALAGLALVFSGCASVMNNGGFVASDEPLAPLTLEPVASVQHIKIDACRQTGKEIEQP